MRPIFLTGYMCSGKTTFGSALAKRLGWPFIDIDDYIEKTEGKTISQIFQEKGEAGFREMESLKLREVSKGENMIIACGGGTPCFHDNIDIINEAGMAVYLATSIPTLLERLIEGKDKRPLVAGKSESEIEEIIREHLKIREPYYQKSRIIWSGEKLDSEEQIRNSVESFIITVLGKDITKD